MNPSNKIIPRNIRRAVALCLPLITGSVMASPITLNFSGHGYFQSTYSPLVFGGNYTINTDWLDANPDGRVGEYSGAGIPYRFSLSWTSLYNPADSGSIGFENVAITVRDQLPGAEFADAVRVLGREYNGFGSAFVEMAFVDLYGEDNRSILTSDALVINPWEVFGHNSHVALNILMSYRPEVHWRGSISHMWTLEAAPVPEPDTMVLLGSGLLLLGFTGFAAKRRRTAD